MPLPITLAHKLVKRVAEVRKDGILDYLGPDCKSQVTVEYDGNTPKRVDAVVLACQHTEDILDQTGKKITDKARQEMIETIARAGVAAGVDGLFLETHFDPTNAQSDGANMLHLDHLEGLLTRLVAIRKTIMGF
jgi:S-adenosylmethionine synthetase